MELASILEHFAGLTDPRVERTRLHSLLDIVAIALCAVICGADNWVKVGLSGHSKVNAARTTKAGIKARQLKAGWDQGYLLSLLNQ